ncbi:MAG: KTSC domain-containing protein [Polynucleobacter sp.]|nr:MAG: KTSC domain-containing protein [Polynucleobacter sp.]
MRVEFPDGYSSLISSIEYDIDTQELTVYFRKYYVDKLTYVSVPEDDAKNLILARSVGRYYLQYIKKSFQTKKPCVMADRVIKVKIDVKKIMKEWLHVGEKGVYLNVTLLYNEEQDKYGNNGMVVQDVPNEIYKQDRSQKGPILGNAKSFDKPAPNDEMTPGKESGKLASPVETDDLPF